MNYVTSCLPVNYNKDVANDIEEIRSKYRKHCPEIHVPEKVCTDQEVTIVDKATTFAILLTSGYLSKDAICRYIFFVYINID